MSEEANLDDGGVESAVHFCSYQLGPEWVTIAINIIEKFC